MSLLNRVHASLKWKRSDQYSANKLGISLEKYRSLKRKVLNLEEDEINDVPNEEKVFEIRENLGEGTAEIKGVSFNEPKSAEEIIKILKIDTTKWKLTSYWNKQTSNRWVVSAFVTKLSHEPVNILAQVLKDFKPKYQPIHKTLINNKFSEKVIAVLSIQDLHFGKEGNEKIVENFKSAIETLVHRAYLVHHIDEIVYVVGGDLLNMDSFNGTTTSGTPVDNQQRAYDAYRDAFDALYWSLNYIKQFCNKLTVIYVPGNHDRLSSYHIAHALEKCFDNSTSIKFKADYSERKVVTYGTNFFAFEHGDVTKKNTPLVYATEFPLEWGNTTYRTCYTGHFHSKKTVEYITENEHNGFSIKHLPSLCSTDYWHYHNKFIGSKRQAIIECHSENYGKLSEFIYTA
jgi:UDP-2,3-diacylglucosamine pyrophosphatase LpxH